MLNNSTSCVKFDFAIASLPSFHHEDSLEPLPLQTRVSSSSLLLDALVLCTERETIHPQKIHSSIGLDLHFQKSSSKKLSHSSSSSQLSAKLAALHNETFDCFDNAPSLEAFDAQATCELKGSSPSLAAFQHLQQPQQHLHQLLQQLCPPQESGLPPTWNGLGANDIVCARGKFMYNHPGCVRFRRVLRTFMPQYKAAETRVKKSQVIDLAIEAVFAVGERTTHGATEEPVRFVKLDTPTGSWSVLGRQKIRNKAGHALREILHENERQKKSKHVRSFDHLFP